MQTELAVSLRALLASPAQDADDWWLIGSTAACLSGADFTPDDVDVFGSSATMTAIVDYFGATAESRPSGKGFRSQPFCRIAVAGGLPIEVMGDLEVQSKDTWHRLRIASRIAIESEMGTVYVPSLEEQVAIFELFGRDKDLAKATILRRMMSEMDGQA